MNRSAEMLNSESQLRVITCVIPSSTPDSVLALATAGLFEQCIVAARHGRAADRIDRVKFIVDSERKRGVLLVEVMGDRAVHRGGEEIVLIG